MKEAAAPNLTINGDTMTDIKNITNFQTELNKPEEKILSKILIFICRTQT